MFSLGGAGPGQLASPAKSQPASRKIMDKITERAETEGLGVGEGTSGAVSAEKMLSGNVQCSRSK